MKLRFVSHFFLSNIIRSKRHPSISSTLAPVSHIETDFADQLFDILKQLLWFLGYTCFKTYVSLTKEVDELCNYFIFANITIIRLLFSKLQTNCVT